MSETLIASLQSQITAKDKEILDLRAEAKDRRIAGKKLKQQNDELTKQVGALTTERDDFKAKSEAGPQELNEKIAELQGQIRTRDHKDAWSGVKEFTVKGDDGKESKYTLNDGVDVDALWKQLGYKPEGDKPDGAKVTGLLGEALKTSGFLFKPVAADATSTNAAGAATQPITTQAGRPGPGSGKPADPSSARANAASQIDAANGDRPAGRIA